MCDGAWKRNSAVSQIQLGRRARLLCRVWPLDHSRSVARSQRGPTPPPSADVSARKPRDHFHLLASFPFLPLAVGANRFYMRLSALGHT